MHAKKQLANASRYKTTNKELECETYATLRSSLNDNIIKIGRKMKVKKKLIESFSKKLEILKTSPFNLDFKCLNCSISFKILTLC